MYRLERFGASGGGGQGSLPPRLVLENNVNYANKDQVVRASGKKIGLTCKSTTPRWSPLSHWVLRDKGHVLAEFGGTTEAFITEPSAGSPRTITPCLKVWALALKPVIKQRV